MPSYLSRELREAAEGVGGNWVCVPARKLLVVLDQADAAEGLAEAAEPFTRIDGAWDPQRLARALARFRAQRRTDGTDTE